MTLTKKPQWMSGQQGKIVLIYGIPCDHVKCNSINIKFEASVSKAVIKVFCWGGDRNIMRLWKWMGGGWGLAARLVNTWIVLFILPQFYAGVLLHGSASPSWKLLWIDIKMQWCKTVNKPQSGRRWVLDLCLGLRMSNIGVVCTSFTIYKFTHQLSLRHFKAAGAKQCPASDGRSGRRQRRYWFQTNMNWCLVPGAGHSTN